jgi:hypothetical protein
MGKIPKSSKNLKKIKMGLSFASKVDIPSA